MRTLGIGFYIQGRLERNFARQITPGKNILKRTVERAHSKKEHLIWAREKTLRKKPTEIQTCSKISNLNRVTSKKKLSDGDSMGNELWMASV